MWATAIFFGSSFPWFLSSELLKVSYVNLNHFVGAGIDKKSVHFCHVCFSCAFSSLTLAPYKFHGSLHASVIESPYQRSPWGHLIVICNHSAAVNIHLCL